PRAQRRRVQQRQARPDVVLDAGGEGRVLRGLPGLGPRLGRAAPRGAGQDSDPDQELLPELPQQAGPGPAGPGPGRRRGRRPRGWPRAQAESWQGGIGARPRPGGHGPGGR
ncbi:hypothetical protein APUTEX25_004776, partial [Auxenochlorella protothecoides]